MLRVSAFALLALLSVFRSGDARADVASSPDNDFCVSVPPDIQCEHISFAGKSYKFPVAEKLIKFFGLPDPQAVEVTIPKAFWLKLRNRVDPERWPSIVGEFDGAYPHYITLPDKLYQWVDVGGWPKPPVRGSLTEIKRIGDLVVWKARATDILEDEVYIIPEDEVYITFPNRSDIYAKCSYSIIESAVHSCDVNWFDGHAIHLLHVPENWLQKAPAYADAYRTAIQTPDDRPFLHRNK